MRLGPITASFPPHPTTPTRARRFVRAALDGHDGATIEHIASMASDLVTSAAVHASSDIATVLTADDGRVRVEVSDAGGTTLWFERALETRLSQQ